MEDSKIIDLYMARLESAIAETANKYGSYCRYIAYNILHNPQDSEECVNDTYLKAWESIPPHCPECLAGFLGKITRNIAINRYKHYNAKKRGQGQLVLALEELKESIPTEDSVEAAADEKAVIEVLNDFLKELGVEARKIFIRRYWYLSSVKEIAADFNIGESKVKMSLHRSRNRLKEMLEKEGVYL